MLWCCCNNPCNGPWNGHRLSCYAQSGKSLRRVGLTEPVCQQHKSLPVGLFWKPYWKSWVLMGLKDPWYSRLVCLNRSHDCHKAVINRHDCCLAKAVVGWKTAEHKWVCMCVWQTKNSSCTCFLVVRSVLLASYCSSMLAQFENKSFIDKCTPKRAQLLMSLKVCGMNSIQKDTLLLQRSHCRHCR